MEKLIELAAPKVHDSVFSFIINEKRGKVLDIACGTGVFSERLVKRGFEVVSADITKEKFKGNTTFVKINANEKFNFSSNSFDVVVSIETIEHLENPWNFLREVYRILRSNGVCILTSPNTQNITSRLLFLFTGRLLRFMEGNYLGSGHITPIFDWNLNWMIKDLFEIEEIEYNRSKCFILSKILKRDILFPDFIKDNVFFGEIKILKLRKI